MQKSPLRIKLGHRTGLKLWILLVRNRRKFLNRKVFFGTFFTFSFFALLTALVQFPLQFADAFYNAQMKMAGGVSQSTNQLRVINKNSCATVEDCQCILFIHGLGDQALTWRKVFKQADQSNSVNLFAVDLPGSGLSPQLDTTQDYSISRLSQLVADEVLPLCNEWAVVGNSFGGWIATRLALMFPGEIQGLMLVSAAGLNADYGHIWPTFVNPTVAGLKSAAEMTYAKQIPWPDFLFKKMITRWDKMKIRDMVLAQVDEGFLDSELSKIKVPVRLFWGEKDQLIPLYMGERFAKGLPQAELIVQDNCGHLAQQECPGAVWDSLQALLDGPTFKSKARKVN